MIFLGSYIRVSVGTKRYLFTLKLFTLVYIRSPRLCWPDCAEKDCVVNWLKNAKLSEAARCLLNELADDAGNFIPRGTGCYPFSTPWKA